MPHPALIHLFGCRASASRLFRRYTTFHSDDAFAGNGDPTERRLISEDEKALQDALHRQRKTEWKRRQGGQTFLDHVVIHVRGGRGGDGCVAFHREKFQQYGPPAGGNGGRGGDIYIKPSSHLTTLSSVPRRVVGNPGGTGSGTWQNGRNGEPTVIEVPVGTVVRELAPEDPSRAPDEWEAHEKEYEGLDDEERRARWRARRFVHFPDSAGDNEGRSAFREAIWDLIKVDRELRAQRRERNAAPLTLDLDHVEDVTIPVDAPLGRPHTQNLGRLVASGGEGGYGNPRFVGPENRSPKFATRGYDGERVSLALELKILADIGLVGMPNAGKSTLLRALTAGRAKSEIASYAFTTLNPFVGVVRVGLDGSIMGGTLQELVHDDTVMEKQRHRELLESGALAHAPTRNQELNAAAEEAPETALEAFRFTVADNPGLIAKASENVGLGHSFLRSMERSSALVYVVDFSGPAPWDQLTVLRDELEKYKPGMSKRARMVIANKADTIDSEDVGAVVQAKGKLSALEEFARAKMDGLDVVAISGKYSQNLRKVVRLMRGYVEDARREPLQPTYAYTSSTSNL
ncbi:GTPase [Vararia minispora EC-137]|uniref:GTPase n=1 Tax=Vararia minispora EC-137 TaxID=1314806 RepID=A0ACB8QI41_9AGAM|nr:GTPase [Vararia minispora EC-137]